MRRFLGEFISAHRLLPRMGYAVIAAMLFRAMATILHDRIPEEWDGYATVFWQLAQILPLVALFCWVGHKRPKLPWEEFRTCLGLLLPLAGAFDVCLWMQWQFAVDPLNTAERILEDAAEQQAPIWVPWVMAVLLAPVLEELLYRGILLWGAIRAGCPPFMAMIFQATFFALAHGDGAYLPSYLLSGTLLGLVSLTRVGLWGAMLLHVALNLRALFWTTVYST